MSKAIPQRSDSVEKKSWISPTTLAFVAMAAIVLILTGCQPEPSEGSSNRGEVALDSNGPDTSFVPGPAEPEAIQISQLHPTPTRIPPATPLPPAPAPTVEVRTPTVAPGPPRSIDDVYILQPGDIVSSIRIVNPHEEIDAGGFRARSNPDMAVSPDGRFVYILDSWLTEVIRGEVRHELIKFNALTKELIWATQIDAIRTPYRSYPNRREVMVSPQGDVVFTYILGVSGEPPSRSLDSRLIAFDSDTGEITGELRGLRCGEWLPISKSELATRCEQRVTIFNVESGQRNELLPFAVPPTQEAADALRFSDVTTTSQPPRLIGATRAGEVIATSALDQPAVSVSKIVQLPDRWHFTMSGRALAASSSDGKLYASVAEEEDVGLADEIWVYDMSSGERTGRITLDYGVYDIEVSQDGTLLYAMGYAVDYNSNLSIIDTESLATIATFPAIGPGVIRTR